MNFRKVKMKETFLNDLDIVNRVQKIEEGWDYQIKINDSVLKEQKFNLDAFKKIFKRLEVIEEKIMGEDYQPYNTTVSQTMDLIDFKTLCVEYHFGFDFQRYLDLVKHFGAVPDDELFVLKVMAVVRLDGAITLIDLISRIGQSNEQHAESLKRLRDNLIRHRKSLSKDVCDVTFADHDKNS